MAILSMGLATLIGLATVAASSNEGPQEMSSPFSTTFFDGAESSSSDQANASSSRQRICGSRKQESLLRIVGGTETAPNEYPWQVMLELVTDGSGSFFNCGGTLIHTRWVLTAAHCAISKNSIMAMAYLGMHSTAPGVARGEEGEPAEDRVPVSCQTIFVRRVVTHEDYVWQTNENDIALVELLHPAQLEGSVQTVCLATGTTEYITNTGTVTGWGMDAYQGGQRRTLHPANLSRTLRADWRRQFRYRVR